MIRDIYTMWLRDMMRYRRNWRYLIFQFVFPFIIIALLGFGFGSIITVAGGVRYIDFLSSGFLVFIVANGALGGGFNLIEERNNGFLKEIIVAPVSRLSIIIGKILARFTIGTVQVVILALLLSLLANLSLSLFWLTLAALIVMTVLFVCLGIIMAGYLQQEENYRTVQGLIIFPLMFISGIFFPIDQLPVWLRWIAYINPVTYAVDLFRYSLLGKHVVPLWLDAVLLLVLGTVSFFISVAVFDRKFRE